MQTEYLSRLGMRSPNYDKTPYVPVHGEHGGCCRGWTSIVSELRSEIQRASRVRTVVAIECYGEVLHDEVRGQLAAGLQPAALFDVFEEGFRSPAEIDTLLEPLLGGDDPIFGYLGPIEIRDYLDEGKVAILRDKIAGIGSGVVLIHGPGASLCCEPDLLVYADMPRWEAQLRQRRGEVSNLGADNRGFKASLQYKRSFFADWRACDRLKRETMARWDYLLDTTVAGDPKMISGDAMRAGLEQASRRPFRLVPFFDPGPWGGQWMRQICDLPDGPPNYAWCFDCVPEENSLVLGFGEDRVEIPSINLVFHRPAELLGEPVYGRFGAEFPIRFDFLDTMGGGHLSFQVHPLVDYARQHFGLSYTQDESYYILDADAGASVYLGLKEDVSPSLMIEDLKIAQADLDRPFPDEKHVAKWAAAKHDHFLIPAGTCHCSGKGSMVLEISHTPYIFTFKMWDWSRLGLDGKPRPINIERGEKNICWDRTESWVKENLINRFEPLASGDGWREERTGLYRSEVIETRRHWFTKPVSHHTQGESVHVLNLVEGTAAIVESPDGAFEPFEVHYAETFVIPAAVGAYRIRPKEANPAKELATVLAYVRTRG